jgi:photosystem II stability/assembly factor-like uncharacterized protein
MKSLFYLFIVIVFISILFLNGCDLLTKQPEKNRAQPPGKDLIISEVFTLSPDKYYDFSWIEVYNPTHGMFQWFYQIFPIVGVVVGSDGSCYYTDDDEATWTKIPGPIGFEHSSFNDISFSVADSGIAVGQGGLILKLRKSGQSFTFDNTPVKNPDTTNKSLNDVIMLPFPGKAGFAVGDSGVIIRTTNRGATWLSYTNSRVSTSLRSFSYVDLSRLYIVGDAGVILKKASGLVWNKKNPPGEFLTTNFKAVYFLNDTGIVIGENGAIGISKNAGEIWNSRESHTTSTLRGIFFGPQGSVYFNPSMGWIVGDNGTVLKSTDMGETWAKKETPSSANFYKVTFVDSNRGSAIGDNGAVMNSSDGGESWEVKTSFTNATLLGMHFNPPDIRIRNRYVLEMYARRKPFFNIINFLDPTQSVVNYEDTLRSDAGIVFFDPQLYADLPFLWYLKTAEVDPNHFPKPIPPNLAPIFGGREVKNVQAGGFTIINNDSTRFDNHTKLGPGVVNIVKASIVYDYDTAAASAFGVKWYLWDLLPQGEIRLVKYLIKEDRLTGNFLGYEKKTIDVVRWGNYMPNSWYLPEDNLWPDNKPAGYIPEWNSLARYANDIGQADPNKLNTSGSFFFAKDPIPAWYSQRRK